MPDRRARHLSYSTLIIDDDSSIRRLLEVVLARTWAFRLVAAVGSCGEALDLVDDLSVPRPDVVLLDYLMPHVDGAGCAPKLRRALPDAKLVLLTVVPDRGRRLLAEGLLDVDAVLDKSLLPPQLVFSLYKVLHPSTTFTQASDLDETPRGDVRP